MTSTTENVALGHWLKQRLAVMWPGTTTVKLASVLQAQCGLSRYRATQIVAANTDTTLSELVAIIRVFGWPPLGQWVSDRLAPPTASDQLPVVDPGEPPKPAGT